MSSLINWEVADGRARELRHIEASVDAHPFARFLLLQFPPARIRHARRGSAPTYGARSRSH